MILKAYHDGINGLTVSIRYNINAELYEVSRNCGGVYWCDRYDNRQKAERRFNEFRTLTDEELENRIRMPRL